MKVGVFIYVTNNQTKYNKVDIYWQFIQHDVMSTGTSARGDVAGSGSDARWTWPLPGGSGHSVRSSPWRLASAAARAPSGYTLHGQHVPRLSAGRCTLESGLASTLSMTSFDKVGVQWNQGIHTFHDQLLQGTVPHLLGKGPFTCTFNRSKWRWW